MAEPFKKDGKWAIRVDAGPDPATGKRRQILRQGYRTKRLAADAQTELLEQVRNGQVVTRSTSTVREYLDQWLLTQPAQVRPTTVHGYSMAVNRINRKIGSLMLQALKVLSIEQMYAGMLSEGLSSKTILNTHAVLRRALADAVRTGLLITNPAASARPPRVRRTDIEAWDAGQATRFLAATRKSELYPIWLLLLATGMRRGEALGLRWGDVDLQGGTLSIEQTRTVAGRDEIIGDTKTDRSRRTLHLEPAQMAVLRELRKRQAADRLAAGEAYDTSHDLVFRDAIGAPLKPDRVSRAFVAAVAETGLPPITVHGCRHTWASIALARGVPMKVVSGQLGHASITVTADIYSHVAPEVARDAVRAVTRGFTD